MVRQGSLLKSLNNNFILLLIAISLGVLLSILWLYESQMILSPGDINPEARQGVFDLSKVDFSEQKFVRLRGEVEFYWNALLSPDDLRDPSQEHTPHYVTIPSAWNGETINGEAIGGRGFATYHFKIRVNSPGMYGLKIKEFESAFHIWINGEDYGGAGSVAENRKDMTPSWQRREFSLYVPDKTVDVVLQISNFHHRLGGASEIMLFGSLESIQLIKGMRTGLETFLLGLLMLLVMYHLTLYIYRKSDKSLIYFALTSLFILLRLSTTGEKLLLGLFPFIPWGAAIRIEYISLPLIGISLVNFIRYMLPDDIPRWFKRSIVYVGVLMSAFILFFPASLFTYTSFSVLIITIYLVFGLFFFLLRALIRKRKHAPGLFLGFAFVFVVMINDVLAYAGIVNSSFLLPFGLIILMLTQAFIISRNFSLAFAQVEKLSIELEEYTETLEEKVENRTRKLREQAETLDEANKRLRELDTFKKEMTRMMVHDLKNPLGNMIGLIQLPELSRDNRELIIYSGIEMQNLIQNILDVTKFEETELKLYPGKALLFELVDAAYQQNKYNFTLNSIRFENKIPRDLIIDVDKELIIRVFVNIMSNATKYLKNEKLIRITSDMIEENKKKFYKISIHNTGELIPEDRLEAIFDVYHQIYAQRSEFKYSSGIGLTFCKMAVEAHGGKIAAKNEENGVTFWFTIPVVN